MIALVRVLVAVALVGLIAFVALDDSLLGPDTPATSVRRDAPGPEELAEEQRIAEETADRLRLFRAGRGEERIVLGGEELSALLRHAVPGVIPPGVSRPTVSLEDGTMHVTARVAPAARRREVAERQAHIKRRYRAY